MQAWRDIVNRDSSFNGQPALADCIYSINRTSEQCDDMSKKKSSDGLGKMILKDGGGLKTQEFFVERPPGGTPKYVEVEVEKPQQKKEIVKKAPSELISTREIEIILEKGLITADTSSDRIREILMAMKKKFGKMAFIGALQVLIEKSYLFKDILDHNCVLFLCKKDGKEVYQTSGDGDVEMKPSRPIKTKTPQPDVHNRKTKTSASPTPKKVNAAKISTKQIDHILNKGIINEKTGAKKIRDVLVLINKKSGKLSYLGALKVLREKKILIKEKSEQDGLFNYKCTVDGRLVLKNVKY